MTAGTLNILANGVVASSTSGSGNAGTVSVSAGTLTIDGTKADPNFVTGIDASTASKGNAGSVTVTAGTLTIAGGGSISSNTFGSGNAGSVSVAASTLDMITNGEITRHVRIRKCR